jgi:hypothetical protein
MPLLAGRNFEATDTKTSTPVAIANETFARMFFPNMNVIGKTFRIIDDRAGAPPQIIEIVGLVKDAKYESVRETTYPQIFCPASQIPEGDNSEVFELRITNRPAVLAPLIQEAIGQVNKGISLEFSSFAAHVDDSLIQERMLATLSSFFGVLALLLAMIGLYGAISYGVTQRRSEFGIRIALGAAPVSILRLVMRDVGLVLLIGAGAGLAISLLTVRLIQKLVFGLGAFDPLAVAGAVTLLAVVALIAGYLPARRAMKVDPMVALRYE